MYHVSAIVFDGVHTLTAAGILRVCVSQKFLYDFILTFQWAM